MVQIGKDRFFTMAETFDKMVQTLVPQYDFMQNEVFRLVNFDKNDHVILIDLGAGSGIFIEKFLKRYPNASAYWVDYSEDFLEIAKIRLEPYKERVKFIISKFEDKWENQISEIPDIIFSMAAIHHLEPQEKNDLYKKSYELLKQGGWFLNVDETKTIFETAYLESLKFWAKFVKDQGKIISISEQKYYDKWNFHFENWKKRNVDNIHIPKIKGDDMHEPFLDQVRHLQQIGFKNADVFIKYHLWAMMGGKK